MKKRLMGAFAALCLLVATFVATMPLTQVQATASWPLEVQDMAVYGVNADSNGGISLSSCRTGGNYDSSPMGYYLDEGQSIRNELEPYATKPQFCNNYGMESLNGILFSFYPTTATSSVFTARKNDRQLWEVDTSSATDCDITSATVKYMFPASVSVGGDGNIYVLLTYVSGDTAMACPERLVGINDSTGDLFMDKALTTPSSPTYNKSQAWTYEDYILVLDRSGTIHKFEYDGDEVTNASYPYTFAPGSGRMFYLSAANANGTVYAVAANTGTWEANSLLYHTDSGSTGSISNSIHSTNASMQYTFDKDGNFIQFVDGMYLDRFDLSGGTVSSITPSNTSGYAYAYVLDYVEDASGNALINWQYYNSTFTSKAISVDFVDGTTSAVTNLFLKTGSGNTKPSEMPNAGIDRAIANGSLYLSLCEDQSSGCGNGSNPPDSWIYKIDVGDFGAPVTHTYGQSGYQSTELNYVAMGDSFSSGEGNTPYLSTGNTCNRSGTAYAHRLMAPYLGLGIGTIDHVACSGATIGDVWSGKNGEPTQLNALDDATDVVTISIGGNDALFASFATECVGSDCGPGSTIYTAVTSITSDPDFVDALGSLYAEILADAQNAEVYVVGYPYVTPSDPFSLACLPFADFTFGSLDTDAVAARLVVDDLNTASSTAVDNVGSARLHFIDPTESGNLFDGHDVCSDDPYFVYPTTDWPNTSWLHPNSAGQQAYADMIAAHM